ncbi:hypothetical protein OKA04_18620 [Luteolibacter flavescens]|uniref:DUF5666 domain-containing protein n=1 Tax=Luteolibacter flavescens TaxID=1859460 RepID=A0ABT3FT69_9BACT|nr:hypothetical protein [Luteolibacter flavescens]MCW1886760.1 hypothetical protein [Luteolibacter flavescens]
MKTKLILAAAVSLLASCQEKSAPAAEQKTPAAPSAELSKVFATVPTGEAKAIHLVRTTVQPGDEITLTGRIMGKSKPFVEGRAAFVLGDAEVLTPCSEKPGDNCETPWDTCCNSAEEKKAGIATIQITGADGKVLAEGVEGVGGLANLATVTVSGEVAPGSSADALIVNATALQVK